MLPSFHNANKPTHRRVMVIGLRPEADSGHALVKADTLVRTAGESHKAN